jgi:hypothetical protein
MEAVNPSKHLNNYITERLPLLLPGIFDGVPDLPDFTVDRGFVPLQQPTYGV